jgi:signal transduction histidine kinase
MRGNFLTLLFLFNSFFGWVQNLTPDLHATFENIKFQDIDKALEIATLERKSAKKNSKAEVDAFIDIGFCYYYKDQYKIGENYLNRAVSIGLKINYLSGVALAEYHLGALTILEGRYAESVIHLNKSKGIFESLNNQYGQALCLNSLGEIFMFQGNLIEAESKFNSSLKLGNNETKGDSYLLLSQLYFRSDRFNESYNFALKSYASGKRNKDLYLQASSLDYLGACELKRGQAEKAEKHLRLSVAIKESLADKQGAAATFIELGKLKLTVDQKDSAYIFIRKAFSLSNRIGAKEEIKKSAILLSHIFESGNRYDSAYLYQKKFVEINTILLQDNAARRIDEIESIAKEKDNQNRINLLNKQKEVDKKSKQTLMLAGFLIIVVLTGSVIILLNRYRLRKKNITELEKWTNLQEALLEISSKYINITEDKISESINDSLAFIGSFLGVDRAYIGDYNHENQTSSINHEWCSSSDVLEIKHFKSVSFERIPQWVNAHFANQDLVIENVDELEDSSLKQLLQPYSVKSLMTVPMIKNGICIGFVGFDTIYSPKTYSKDERHIMKIFSEMLINIFERSNYIKTIQKARNDIEKYNTYLEEIVEEQTRKNIELTKSISEQEKLVTIGEISAGITHDLNTPLASTRSGLENIDYSVKKIFEESIPNLIQSEITELYTISQNRELAFFQSTMKMRQEHNKMITLLQNKFEVLNEDSEELSKLFVDCQIKDSEHELILRILKMSNRTQALKLLHLLMSMQNMLGSSLISVKRAADVVGTLRTFIKNPANDQLKEINLHHSLQSVLSIFSHEIRNKIVLEFEVVEQLSIEGYEVKLFQLWSNLIKNAIEAMQETDEKKLIIRSSQTKDKINIAISNTGENIPEELKQKIFDKFFSTKSHKSGTGLGLSIVKTIIEDHGAELTLESNESITTFVVSFKKNQNG